MHANDIILTLQVHISKQRDATVIILHNHFCETEFPQNDLIRYFIGALLYMKGQLARFGRFILLVKEHHKHCNKATFFACPATFIYFT